MVTRKAIVIVFGVLAAMSGFALAAPPAGRSFEPPRIKHAEKEIEPGVWRLTTRSNGLGYAETISVYRAAQLLAAKGFTYVQVIDQKGQLSWRENELERGKMRNMREFMQLTVRGAHESTRPTDCRSKRQDRCMTFPAASVLARLGPKIPAGFSVSDQGGSGTSR